MAGAGENQIELMHLEKPTETRLCCGTETKTGSLEKKKNPFFETGDESKFFFIPLIHPVGFLAETICVF